MAPEPHTIKELKALIPLLRQAAEMYFTDPTELNTICGICKVLEDIADSEIKVYIMMDDLMEHMGEPNRYYGDYSRNPEDWEPRAYMCLFLAEYLKGAR